MKNLLYILLILSLISCGDYENEMFFNSHQNSLALLSPKTVKDKKSSIPSIANLLKKVELSITDDPEKLSTSDTTPKFQINSTVDIYIACRFSYYSGIHNLGMRIYLPDGSLYIDVNTQINFNLIASYSSNGIIVENSGSTLIAKYIMPVAGTELAIFMITGKYKVEISLDGDKLIEKEFTLE
ncbi:MAG: hypothetical protein QW076_01795 [Candidatus Anstonellales archaeon]